MTTVGSGAEQLASLTDIGNASRMFFPVSTSPASTVPPGFFLIPAGTFTMGDHWGASASQIACAMLPGDVQLELAPQKPQVGVAPYRPLAVIKLPGPDAFHNELPVHSILLESRCITEGCAFANPFTGFDGRGVGS